MKTDPSHIAYVACLAFAVMCSTAGVTGLIFYGVMLGVVDDPNYILIPGAIGGSLLLCNLAGLLVGYGLILWRDRK